MDAISVKGLSKNYGSVRALQNVSFNVGKGELFGLIGPDGAGKTTLFRLLATLINPDAGSATVNGFDISQDYLSIRRHIGYMPGKFSLYPDLTVEENLEFFAALFGSRVEDSYDLVAPVYRQIEPFKRRRAGKLSGGMKQKLALSCALIHRPSVLLLDEPTTGVDAVSRSEFWDMLDTLREKSITVLVSTPYMDEAGRCDRIALMSEGKILTVDAPSEILKRYDAPLMAVCARDMHALLQSVRSVPGVADCYPFGEYHHVVCGPDFSKAELENQHRDIEGFRAAAITPTIEDVFIKLMKK
ncbi:MAG: ABC transporter ATP-binding protein [Bacteroidaceae bacterium]|nr:ABC transporter ATP-binding protein [Bacteroidaceae bacterium]